MAELAKIGDNNPPEMIQLASDVTRQISTWFAENPAVTTEKEAREIKLQIDRAKLCLKDLEDERDSKVRPLNDEVNAINLAHREVRKPLGVVLDMMLITLDSFLKDEEDKRIRAAMIARKIAQEAENRAREAEQIEKEKLENARLGEVGIDIASIVENADNAFDEYQKAERAAIRAQEEAHVKIGGGLGRAIGLSEKEVLHIDDPVVFMRDVVSICAPGGLPQGLTAAILTAARTIRRTHNRLPNGISATIERRTR